MLLIWFEEVILVVESMGNLSLVCVMWLDFFFERLKLKIRMIFLKFLEILVMGICYKWMLFLDIE